MKILLNSRSIVILSVFLLFACSGVDDKQSVLAAKKYIENNQLREAGLELKNALQANLKNAEARYLLGEINLTIGDMASAAKEFRKAREAGWDEAQSQIGLMRALIYQREFKKVLDDIQIKDTYPSKTGADLYGLKAFAEAASGYAGLANQSIKQGIALDKDAFQVLKTSIQLDVTSGKSDAAARQIKHALSLYENNSELLLLSAFLAMQNNDSVAAAEQFQKIISLEPKNLVTFNGRKARLGFARLEILKKNLDQATSLLMPLFKQYANDPETNYIGGLLAFEQADFDLAEERLLKVLKVAPKHAKTQLLFGAVNFAQKDYEQATYYISQYLQLEPENIGARKLLGKAYILMGQHEEAQTALRRGLQGNGDNDAELLALVGLSELKAGDITSGITDLEKAVVAKPTSNVLRGELAKAYISAGETENALNQLTKILTEGGNRNQAEVLMVSAYLRAKQYDQAIDVVLDIHQRSPQDVAILSLVGHVFSASGDSVEARKYFNQALTIEPENIQVTMLLAALEEADGNVTEAEKLYKGLIKSDAPSTDPILALARLSEQKKDYKAMLAWLEKANENAPLDLRPKKVLAEYYFRENKLDKVEGLIKEATVISANDPGVLLIKGKMLMRQKRFNEAVLPLKELVTRAPESVYARSLLAETYLNLQQTGDARHQLELVLEQKPYYVPALLVLARVEQAAKQYAQGLEHIKKVIKAQPDQYQAYDLGGDISMAAKNYAAANDYYQKVMSIKPNSATAIKSAESLIQLSKNQQAIKVLKQWLSKNTEDVRARQFLGNAYLTNGENKEAIQSFEAVYAEQPENIVALNNLAWLYSVEKDSRALEFAEKAYKIKPNDGGIQDTYGWILVQQGKVEEGQRMLKQAMQALPAVPDVRYHYAVALLQTGEKTAAHKILKELLQSNQPYEWREEAQKLLSQ